MVRQRDKVFGERLMLHGFRGIIFLLFLSAGFLFAAEYLVSPGDDLQHAIDQLRAGDVLTLRPGEYHAKETLLLQAQGEADKPIRIRGAQRHLSVLTSWEDHSYDWEPVPGKPFVFRATALPLAVAVTELDTGIILRAAASLSDMECFRASFFHDSERQVLYLHCSDAVSPQLHRIRVSTYSGSLLKVKNAAHVQISQLTFTGSNHIVPSDSRFGSAIWMDTSSHVTIEECDFYFNSGGVYITFKSESPVVRNCFFRRNDGLGYSEMAQLFFHQSSNNCLAENNIVVDGRTHGIRFYSGASNVIARGNIIRNEYMGLYFKASRAPRLAERNVILDCLSFNYSDLVGRPTLALNNSVELPSSMEDPGESNLLFDARRTDPLFCAPDHNDFRLQEGSPFAGKGAFPEAAPVYFVAAHGSDNANGRSVAQAFASLEKAASVLQAGDTLYLLAGEYAWHPLPDGVKLRGREWEAPPQLQTVSLVACANISIANIKVAELQVQKSRDLQFERVYAEKFTLEEVSKVHLFRCNLGYFNAEAAESSQLLFSVLPAGSWSGVEQFYNGPVAVVGPGCHALTRGAEDFRRLRPLARIDDIQQQVDSDRALITWTTPECSSALWNPGGGWHASRPIMAQLEYGTTPDCPNSMPSFGEIFHSLAIRDLTPGEKYYYRIRIPERIFSLHYSGKLVEEPERNHTFVGGAVSPVRSFVTAAADTFQARSFIIGPEDNLLEVSRQVRAGDSVVMRPGVYRGTFRPLASGRAGLPITLRAEQPGTVLMDGSANLRPGAVLLEGLEHIVIQGLIFKNFSNKLFAHRGGMYYGQVQIYNSSDIVIRDCVFLGHGTYQFLIEMREVDKVQIRNNVFSNGVNQVNGGMNKSIDIIGNTFHYPLIRNIAITHGQEDGVVTVRKNIFLGKSRQKVMEAITYGEINGGTTVFDDNIWYFSPEDPYRFCGFENLLALPKEERGQPAGLKRLREKTSYEQNGREIEYFRFLRHDYLDPFVEAERFKQEFQQAVKDGSLLPTLEYFTPHPDLGLQGYGARAE